MKTLIPVLVFAMALSSAASIWAEKRQSSSQDYAASTITLKGKVTCAKSELNDSPTCQTVLVVRDPEGANENNRDNERDTVYYFDPISSKKYHKAVCEQGVNATVEGKITEKDGIKTITVTKLTWKNGQRG